MPSGHFKDVRVIHKVRDKATPDTPTLPAQAVRIELAESVLRAAQHIIDGLGVKVVTKRGQALDASPVKAGDAPSLATLVDACARLQFHAHEILALHGVDDTDVMPNFLFAEIERAILENDAQPDYTEALSGAKAIPEFTVQCPLCTGAAANMQIPFSELEAHLAAEHGKGEERS